MPRPAQFTHDDLLVAARNRIVEHGPTSATVAAIAADAGAPTGSLYHRFRSRDLLVATLWLETIEHFQVGIFAALDQPDPRRAARDAAAHLISWCRTDSASARLLLLHRREDLVGPDWPDEVRDRAVTLNVKVEGALKDLARRCFGTARAGDVRRIHLAVVGIPFGAVHAHLVAGKPPPPDLDELVLRAHDAVMET